MIGERVQRFCALHHIEGPLLAAVSGGVDSTALLVLLHELGFAVSCAHINHRLRGSDSYDDEQFVRDLCARLGIPLHVEDGTLEPRAVKDRGVEAAAREVRYARLRELRDRTGARWVATAHQQNDQAETVLLRLISGGGMGSLRGIQPVRDDGFIRPLLDVPRDELTAFLAERGITPRIDRTNADDRFLRNRLRKVLGDLGPAATKHLAAVSAEAREKWPVIERAVDEAEHVEVTNDETRFLEWPDEEWLRASLLHRHIRRMDPVARDVDIRKLASRISVSRELEVVLRRRPVVTPPFEYRLTPGEPLYLAEIDRTIHVANGKRTTDNGQRFQLPAVATSFTVRNRREGDRYGHKKLKSHLIDRKIRREIRDGLPLLVWNDEIVWIEGVGVAEKFRVNGPSGEGNVLYEVWMEGPGESNHD
ncbi:MAG TPA: tRNA lysidine(34) synthetase TilS [Thermoanaerobaculia bacterium]